mmetsp:Transcript_1821/g.3931  ORF Transcript_1821/g.3931 Transcript_1821/m.3931 type:complete len:240 (+) Transcript_1821:251-970(+)
MASASRRRSQRHLDGYASPRAGDHDIFRQGDALGGHAGADALARRRRAGHRPLVGAVVQIGPADDFGQRRRRRGRRAHTVRVEHGHEARLQHAHALLVVEDGGAERVPAERPEQEEGQVGDGVHRGHGEGVPPEGGLHDPLLQDHLLRRGAAVMRSEDPEHVLPEPVQGNRLAGRLQAAAEDVPVLRPDLLSVDAAALVHHLDLDVQLHQLRLLENAVRVQILHPEQRLDHLIQCTHGG